MNSDEQSGLRIAIVGCGKVADQHVQAIHRIPDCQIVSVCDRELLMAAQLAERFRVPESYDDLDEMLRGARPDVVHITTPPQSHCSLAKQCLESGSHVYLEKPFAMTALETEVLIELAENRALKVTAGHNYQFTLEMLEMRRLVEEGFLGGKPIHLESYWSYSLGDLSYVGPVLGNRSHWVRELPGQLFHNIISHGIARIAGLLERHTPRRASAPVAEMKQALACVGHVLRHQVGRAGHSQKILRVAGLRSAEGADLAIRPRLLGQPCDRVVPVLLVAPTERPIARVDALRLLRAAEVLHRDHVSFRCQHAVIPLAGFDGDIGVALFVQHRPRPRSVGKVEVHREPDAIAHRYHHMLFGHRLCAESDDCHEGEN